MSGSFTQGRLLYKESLVSTIDIRGQVFFIPSGYLFIRIDLDLHHVYRFHDYLTLPLFNPPKFRIAEFQ